NEVRERLSAALRWPGDEIAHVPGGLVRALEQEHVPAAGDDDKLRRAGSVRRRSAWGLFGSDLDDVRHPLHTEKQPSLLTCVVRWSAPATRQATARSPAPCRSWARSGRCSSSARASTAPRASSSSTGSSTARATSCPSA